MYQVNSSTGMTRIVYAARYSIQGLRAAWCSEAAFRQEVTCAIPLILATFFLPVSAVEQALLITSVVMVILLELLNTGIEAVVDRIGSERHELSKVAKDVGSAAVLIAIILAVLTWILILVA